MGKFMGSQQLLLGEARQAEEGLIVIGLASEPQIVASFFENWDIRTGIDRDAFVADLARRDLMLLDLQACFLGVLRDDYDPALTEFVPEPLKGEIVYLGTVNCLEEPKEMEVLLVQGADGTVRGVAGSDETPVLLAVMFNGSREDFTAWNLVLMSDSPDAGYGNSSSSSGGDEPDV
jgi:hypothetical protein